jgi:signal peptidase I
MTAPQHEAWPAGPAGADPPAGHGSPAGTPSPKGRRRATSWAIEIAETIVLTVVIFFVIQHLIAQPFQVQGPSMETTFLDGQYVLVDRLTPNWAPYAHGQVVVFQPPAGVESGNYPFIKRVIGVAGDTVELRDGRVFVNGAAVAEPYTYRDGTGAAQPTEPTAGVTSWTVPAGDVFVLGDHRQVSEDSRVFGPVPVSSVVGRAFLRYWPLSVFGPVQTPASP